MQVNAKLKYFRIAPRKARLVADLIRGKQVKKAETILNFTVKKAAKPLLKLLKSALANASNNFHLDTDNLYISKITVDEGPKFKRWMPRARGSASEIQKKTSHITLVLDEIKPGKKKIAKKSAGKKKSEEEKREKEFIAKKPRVRPAIKPPLEESKPKVVRGIRRIFQRKAI